MQYVALFMVLLTPAIFLWFTLAVSPHANRMFAPRLFWGGLGGRLFIPAFLVFTGATIYGFILDWKTSAILLGVGVVLARPLKIIAFYVVIVIFMPLLAPRMFLSELKILLSAIPKKWFVVILIILAYIGAMAALRYYPRVSHDSPKNVQVSRVVLDGANRYLDSEYAKIEDNGFNEIMFETSKEDARKILEKQHIAVEKGSYSWRYFSPGKFCYVMTSLHFLNDGPFKSSHISLICSKEADLTGVKGVIESLELKSIEKNGNPWISRVNPSGQGQYKIWKMKKQYLIIAFTPDGTFEDIAVPCYVLAYSKRGMNDKTLLDSMRDRFGF